VLDIALVTAELARLIVVGTDLNRRMPGGWR
jgi:hypothetical protein